MVSKTLAKKDVRKHYDSLRNFEGKSDSYYFKRRAAYLKSFTEMMPKSSLILNLGCGNGIFSDFLKSLRFSNIVDVELSFHLLRQSKSRMRILGDAENLPFKEGVFDVCIMTDVVEHIEDRKKAFAELHTVLKKNKMVFITYPNHIWVPILNFLGKIGAKVDARDNKIPPELFEKEIRILFDITSFKTAILMSKLPSQILNIFEYAEVNIPKKIMKHLGILHVYIIKKR